MNEITKTNTKNVRVGLDELIKVNTSATAKLPDTDLEVDLSFGEKQITIKVVLNGKEICNQTFYPSIPGIPLILLNPQATSLRDLFGGGDTKISSEDDVLIDLPEETLPARQQIDLSKSLQLTTTATLELSALVGKTTVELDFCLAKGNLRMKVALNGNDILSQDFPFFLTYIYLNEEAIRSLKGNSIAFSTTTDLSLGLQL